jgi:small-conductance mechanosensitive channel
MDLLSAIWAEAVQDRTLWVLGALVAFVVMAKVAAPLDKHLLKGPWVLAAIHLGLVPVAGILRFIQAGAHGTVHMTAVAFAALALVSTGTALLFGLLLPWVGVRTSRIFQDVATAAASIVVVFSVASRAGINISGLVATSAVLTAVIGFALKDTLGNVIGGLSLHTDKSIGIGDWIKVGDQVGRVVDIRWRYTAVETRNWETLIVPNSVLTTEKVMVLGRRRGEPIQWRRWVWFNVDYRTTPEQVIRTVQEALCAAPIPGVALDPPAHCILMDLHESYARYAARYWLTDLPADDGTDSVVRRRIYFAMQRAGIPFSMPGHAIFVTEETQRQTQLQEAEQARRFRALERVDLFKPLEEEDRVFLAERLRYAPFAPGEVLTRQGAEGHWLYLILEGEAAARVAGDDGADREVARLKAGQFFGEMALLTGEPRTATVVAVTGVECYRLDAEAFQEIIQKRPAIAEPVAEILARRRVELAAVKGDLDQEAQRRRLAAAKTDMLDKIRNFFGLAQDDAPRRAAR